MDVLNISDISLNDENVGGIQSFVAQTPELQDDDTPRGGIDERKGGIEEVL